MGQIRGLAETVLSVRDLPKSLAFYRDTLGPEVISPPGLPAVFLRAGRPGDGVTPQMILVLQPPASSPAGEPLAERRGLEHQEIATRSGVHPLLPVEAFYIDDPDGDEVEIVARTG